MGLFSGLLTLPLAPVKGVVWVAQQLAEEAERELYDERRIRGQLHELEFAFERGEISETQYEREEEALLDRLDEARRRKEGIRGNQ